MTKQTFKVQGTDGKRYSLFVSIDYDDDELGYSPTAAIRDMVMWQTRMKFVGLYHAAQAVARENECTVTVTPL